MGITLLSFTPGTTIASASVNADLNAIANALGGVTFTNFLFISPDNTTPAQTNRFSSTPTSDAAFVACNLGGDTSTRVDLYQDTTAGQGTGGIRAGDGGTIYAKMFAYYGGNVPKLQERGWHVKGSVWTEGYGINANGLLLYDDPTNNWSVWDGLHNLSFRLNGTHAFAATTSNTFTYSGSNYGFIGAGASVFNVGSTYADVAEPLLTAAGVIAGMVVCISDDDTVSPCSHEACRVAKIMSTSPSMLLAPRATMVGAEGSGADVALPPLPGHESAMPIVIGGITPVLMVEAPHLRDRITSAGLASAGKCRVARDEEYSLGDIVSIRDGVYYAWIHY